MHRLSRDDFFMFQHGGRARDTVAFLEREREMRVTRRHLSALCRVRGRPYISSTYSDSFEPISVMTTNNSAN